MLHKSISGVGSHKKPRFGLPEMLFAFFTLTMLSGCDLMMGFFDDPLEKNKTENIGKPLTEADTVSFGVPTEYISPWSQKYLFPENTDHKSIGAKSSFLPFINNSGQKLPAAFDIDLSRDLKGRNPALFPQNYLTFIYYDLQAYAMSKIETSADQAFLDAHSYYFLIDNDKDSLSIPISGEGSLKDNVAHSGITDHQVNETANLVEFSTADLSGTGSAAYIGPAVVKSLNLTQSSTIQFDLGGIPSGFLQYVRFVLSNSSGQELTFEPSEEKPLVNSTNYLTAADFIDRVKVGPGTTLISGDTATPNQLSVRFTGNESSGLAIYDKNKDSNNRLCDIITANKIFQFVVQAPDVLNTLGRKLSFNFFNSNGVSPIKKYLETNNGVLNYVKGATNSSILITSAGQRDPITWAGIRLTDQEDTFLSLNSSTPIDFSVDASASTPGFDPDVALQRRVRVGFADKEGNNITLNTTYLTVNRGVNHFSAANFTDHLEGFNGGAFAKDNEAKANISLTGDGVNTPGFRWMYKEVKQDDRSTIINPSTEHYIPQDGDQFRFKISSSGPVRQILEQLLFRMRDASEQLVYHNDTELPPFLLADTLDKFLVNPALSDTATEAEILIPVEYSRFIGDIENFGELSSIELIGLKLNAGESLNFSFSDLSLVKSGSEVQEPLFSFNWDEVEKMTIVDYRSPQDNTDQMTIDWGDIQVGGLNVDFSVMQPLANYIVPGSVSADNTQATIHIKAGDLPGWNDGEFANTLLSTVQFSPLQLAETESLDIGLMNLVLLDEISGQETALPFFVVDRSDFAVTSAGLLYYDGPALSGARLSNVIVGGVSLPFKRFGHLFSGEPHGFALTSTASYPYDVTLTFRGNLPIFNPGS